MRENLAASIDAWNTTIAARREDPFGRQDRTVPIHNAPFYAIRVTPGIHYCMGGLAIDANARVLDTDGAPIPGLFAAGEATGGIHGVDRLGGNSLTDAMVFGRLAGTNAAQYDRP